MVGAGGLTSGDSVPLPADPVVVRVKEGGVANFTVTRAGPADFVATVTYRVEYGDATAGDLVAPSNDSLVFNVGESMRDVSVEVQDDNIPETDEAFHLVLSNATGE